MRLPLLALAACLACAAPTEEASSGVDQPPRPRLLVLTDIGGDPDDRQSMVRLLAYANEFEIEGLIATSAGIPGELEEPTVRPDLIDSLVMAYGDVHGNLVLHDAAFPPAESLATRIVAGNPLRGLDHIGTGWDTDGSRHIVDVVDREAPGPVHVTVWGGQTDLAQALWSVREGRGAEGLARFVERMRVHDIADQDGIAEWIIAEFPGLHYVLNGAAPGADRRDAPFRGMYLGGDESLTSLEWLNEHVRTGHGPLGELYPSETWTAPNPHGALKEGDTPSWFSVLPVGLADPERPEWGGWGGRHVARGGVFAAAADTLSGEAGPRVTVSRWRPAFQADFQARMDWMVRPPAETNHAPRVVVAGDRMRQARAGERVIVDAAASSDPDGDQLRFRWWIYEEAGSHPGGATVASDDAPRAELRLPENGGGTVHLILEVTDDGEPALTRYGRVVVEVEG